MHRSIDQLEPRRLFALANNGISTITGTDYQSIDAIVEVPGGYAVAGMFGANTKFGNGLPSRAPRGETDVFISVVKGKSASLRTLGGSEDGELDFKDDRAQFASIGERVDEDYLFGVSARPKDADEYISKLKLGPDGKLYAVLIYRGDDVSLDTGSKKATTLKAGDAFGGGFYDSAILRFGIDGANLKLEQTINISGPFNDLVFDIDFDSAGNLLAAGSFERNADFDPGKGVFRVEPDGRSDAFVAKYSRSGKLQWVRQFGSDAAAERDIEAAYGIAVDASDNIFLGGVFAGDADFDPRSGRKNEHIVEARDETDGFTLKLHSDGLLDWVRTQGGDEFDGVRDVAIAPGGGVYNIGYFGDEIDVDPTARERIFRATEDDIDDSGSIIEDTDLFYSRFDAKGNLVWARQIAGTGRELVGSISSDAAGNLAIAGSFAGIVDVDPSKRKRTLRSAAADIDDRNGDRERAYAGFVVTVSRDAVYRRSRQIDGQRQQDVFVIDTAPTSAGGLLVAGRYLGGFTLRGTELRVTTQKKPSGHEDGYALVLDDGLAPIV